LKPSERDPILYLEDIVLSMQRVQEYIAELNFYEFKRDYKTVDAVIRNFEIIGEASKNLPQEIKDKNTNIPWQEMYRLRNRISHEYFGIDYEIIWNILTEQLPQNLNDTVALLAVERSKKNKFHDHKKPGCFAAGFTSPNYKLNYLYNLNSFTWRAESPKFELITHLYFVKSFGPAMP
jgi:uncharacterized protein with HEPN domain